MSAGAAIIALASGLVMFALLWALMSAGDRTLLASLARVRPSLRALVLLVLAAAPVYVGVFAGLGVLLFPHASPFSMAQIHDHQILNGWGSAGSISQHIGVWLTLLISALLLARLSFVLASRLSALSQFQALLDRASSPLSENMRELVTHQPRAFVTGLVRPVIYLDRALAERVGKDGCEIMTAHERAHIKRGDLLTRLVMDVMCSLYPRSVSQRLQHAFILAQEQACDAQVARAHAPVRIAETLLRFERASASGALVSARFEDADIALRIRALLEPDFEPAPLSLARASALVLALFVPAFVMLEPMHHQIEALFLVLGG